MYDNNPYEEYMRNTLGYNVNPTMMNNMNMYPNNQFYEDENNFGYNQANVDNMYPEIYRIIYPMVCKACMNTNENITEDLVSRITNEIYINIENIEISKENRNSSNVANNNQTNKNVRPENVNSKSNLTDTTLNRQEDRNRNPLLRDLIRILVLRELLGRPNRPPFRPPVRPPFGPGPF